MLSKSSLEAAVLAGSSLEAAVLVIRNYSEAASCFEPDECLVQNSCSVTETTKSPVQDKINIAVRKKCKKIKKTRLHS